MDISEGHKHQLPYMHQWEIETADELPLQNSKRKLTDVCCLIIGVLFGLILFIVAFAVLNRDHLNRSNFPTDSLGNVCALDAHKGDTQYPFVFFQNIQDPNSKRYCVSDCPQQGLKPNCFTSCEIGFYPNYPTSNRLGSYCLPSDEIAKEQLFATSGLYLKWNSLRAIDYLLIGLAISIALSALWMLLTQCLTRVVIWLSIILSIILLLITAIVLFTGTNQTLSDAGAWPVFFGIICILLLLVVLYYAFFHRNRITLASRFLEIAGSSLISSKLIFLNIVVFVGITFLFGILVVFEYLAFSSAAEPVHSQNQLFSELQRNGFLTFLLVIETIWGLSFFRDAFNYIISGNGVDWYFKKPFECCGPTKLMFTKNLGSIAGGSFLSGFLYLPSLIVQLFFAAKDCCLCNLFDLTRSDAYSYIYLTGNSYCPSVRQAQYLCYRSKICRENESTIAFYALIVRIFISLSSILIVYWITSNNLVEEKVPAYLLLGIFFISLYISSYFIDIHVHTAEALMICFLAEYDLESVNYQGMKICPESLKNVIVDLNKTGQI